MLAVPPELTLRYEAWLKKQRIMTQRHHHYHKWLRYYLDFCHKYRFAPLERRSLSAFQEKLRTKQQPESLRQQAQQAGGVVLGNNSSSHHGVTFPSG